MSSIVIIQALIILSCMWSGLPLSQDDLSLLEETMCVESDFGRTSTNIMQMEEETRQDIINHYIRYNPEYNHLIKGDLDDPIYCISMARLHYIRTGVVTPGTRLERAKLWKSRFNTYLGKGTVTDYLYKAHLYLGDK